MNAGLHWAALKMNMMIDLSLLESHQQFLSTYSLLCGGSDVLMASFVGSEGLEAACTRTSLNEGLQWAPQLLPAFLVGAPSSMLEQLELAGHIVVVDLLRVSALLTRSSWS